MTEAMELYVVTYLRQSFLPPFSPCGVVGSVGRVKFLEAACSLAASGVGAELLCAEQMYSLANHEICFSPVIYKLLNKFGR